MEKSNDLIEWIRTYSGCKDAKFINPTETEVLYSTVNETYKIENIKSILSIGGLYLVEELGSEDDWMMGQKHKDGKIYCWGNYGQLKDAIDGL